MKKDYMSLQTESKLSSEKDSPKTVADAYGEAVFLFEPKGSHIIKRQRVYHRYRHISSAECNIYSEQYFAYYKLL